jgi:NTP pyrophosphatase (non-canonical NTP hydrolase)
VSKYITYSTVTGIDSNSEQFQGVEQLDENKVSGEHWSKTFLKTSVPSIVTKINDFADERDWNQFHTMRNLQLAVIGELGELCEILQFKGDDEDQSLSATEINKMGQELADVTMYLLRLAEACSVTGMIIK